MQDVSITDVRLECLRLASTASRDHASTDEVLDAASAFTAFALHGTMTPAHLREDPKWSADELAAMSKRGTRPLKPNRIGREPA